MRRRSFSGIQPSGIPTIGNYFGALRHWVNMQDEYDGVYCVVDMHALTIRRSPQELAGNIRYLYALLRAVGIDPDRSTLFVQSHVPAHAQMMWLLSCYTMYGEMLRMTQFKDKSKKHPDNVNTGLFIYPVLQAADILLYDAHAVPIGADQKQHVEITRDIAERVNALYGPVFTLPEPLIPPVGGKILSLLDPTRKMDKSDPLPGAYISLDDSRAAIAQKLKRAVTDSEGSVRYDPEHKPGVSNLLGIYSLCEGITTREAEGIFSQGGYGALKDAVTEALDATLAPVREKVACYLADLPQLDALMREGAEKASAYADTVLRKLCAALGLLP
ncbi:MAG: tryptophan--tRNA ligase [Oscillospiraceae bacterium]|jgi:tryptophanyl-tRNA synthetase|nr:tryptophan--tRNA ligase [Oscillospiraceae bacterium]